MNNLYKIKILIIFIITLAGKGISIGDYSTFKIDYPEAEKVSVAGSFNNWDKIELKKDESGLWKKEISLEPGIYQYKFIINGKKWILDPKAPKVQSGVYTNSQITVGTQEEIKNVWIERAKRIKSKTKSFNNYSKFKEKERDKFSFLVFGDCRTNYDIYEKIASNMAEEEKIDIIFGTGDYVTQPQNEEEWKKFIKYTKYIKVPIFLTIGNHEIAGQRYADIIYKELVEHPKNEIFYEIKYSNSHFIILSSEEWEKEGRISDTQFNWLKNVLNSSKKKHKFIFTHRPFYIPEDIGHHRDDAYTAYPELRDKLWKLFKKNNITAVFCGHEHFYNRMKINEIYHIITGGAGAPLYAEPERGGFYHYIRIDVNKDEVRYSCIKVSTETGKSEVVDKF